MKQKILKRIKDRGIEYIVGLDIRTFKGENVAYPWFMISKKSSKKLRGKMTCTEDEHFKLTGCTPFYITRQIQRAFFDAIMMYDYVVIDAYNDQNSKRLELYDRFMKLWGFKVIKRTRYSLLYSRKTVKKKIINRIFK